MPYNKKEIIICECGSNVTRDSLNRHRKTNKHNLFVGNETNYQQGKIYKIISDSKPELVYYGSTNKSLKQRFQSHREKYRAYIRGTYHFVYAWKLLELEDSCIILVEEYPCNTKQELDAKEGEYIRNNTCVNKLAPTGGNKVQLKKQKSEKDKRYREKHKEKLDIINKEKFECECGGSYNRKHKTRHMRSKLHQRFLIKE